MRPALRKKWPNERTTGSQGAHGNKRFAWNVDADAMRIAALLRWWSSEWVQIGHRCWIQFKGLTIVVWRNAESVSPIVTRTVSVYLSVRRNQRAERAPRRCKIERRIVNEVDWDCGIKISIGLLYSAKRNLRCRVMRSRVTPFESVLSYYFF